MIAIFSANHSTPNDVSYQKTLRPLSFFPKTPYRILQKRRLLPCQLRIASIKISGKSKMPRTVSFVQIKEKIPHTAG